MTRNLLVSLNGKNGKKSRFAQVRYAGGTPDFGQRGDRSNWKRHRPNAIWLVIGTCCPAMRTYRVLTCSLKTPRPNGSPHSLAVAAGACHGRTSGSIQQPIAGGESVS